jgi:hypothetical protein
VSGRGSRFSFRAAPSVTGVPRRRPRLRAARDTIFAQRGPRRENSDHASAGRAVTLPLAGVLVAVTALAAAFIRSFAMYGLIGLDMVRYNAIAMPLIAGVLTMLFFASRRVARGRALTILAAISALCPILAGSGGYSIVGLIMLISGAIAFAAVPIALDWIALQGSPSAARAAVLLAAAQLGTVIGNAPSLTAAPPPPAMSLMLILPVILCGLAARLRPTAEPDARPSFAATQTVLGNYAILGLIAAAVTATAGILILGASLPAISDEGAILSGGTMQLAVIVLLIGGGLLADRFAEDARGYARWFVATLAIAGFAALCALRLEVPAAAQAILLARMLPFAGIGAALALILRIAPPPARLGALLAFFAARAVGAAIVAPALARGDPATEVHAIGYGALGLLVAAAAVAASMPRRGRA